MLAVSCHGGHTGNSCIKGKDFIVLNEVIIDSNTKASIVKNSSSNYQIMSFAKDNCAIVQTKNILRRHSNFELDSIRKAGSITTVELFLRQEGDNTSIGFIISYDFNKNFKYIAVSDVTSEPSEGIKRIQIDSSKNIIRVDLYDLESHKHFVSSDSCRTWHPEI